MLLRLKYFVLVLMSTSMVWSQSNIIKMEYYIGADPGPGMRVDIPLVASNAIDMTFNVPTSSLAEGFHVITILAQDENLVWSHYESRPFYVNQSSTLTQNQITKMEYFIGEDPGHGMGVDIPLTDAVELDILQYVPTDALSEGFHVITIRAQDVNGQWGFTERRAFFVNQSSTLTQNQITKMEYFIGEDPGHGMGVDIPITDAVELDILQDVPTDALSEGFHVITLRAQDANGQWGLTERRAFYVNQSSTLTQNQITKIEYFIDEDPGQGMGVDVPISAAANVNFQELISTDEFSSGFHLMTIRAQDENGLWSVVENKPFFVDTRNVVSYEYAIDIDPGAGLATAQSVTPLNEIEETFEILTADETLGSHDLIVRVQNNYNMWSKGDTVTFDLCDGALADFSVAEIIYVNTPILFTDLSINKKSGDLYSWDFDGDGLVDENTEGDASFIYETPGTFNVTLTIDRLGCVSSKTITVEINDNLPPNLVYIFYLDENSEAGTLVGQVAANSTSTYAIVSGNINDAFIVDAMNGKLMVASPEALDFETSPIFELVVEALSENDVSTLIPIMIHLNDIVDENPLETNELAQNVRIYPNPTVGSIFIEGRDMSLKDMGIELFTLSGKQVSLQSEKKEQLGNKIILYLANIKPGIYLLRLRYKKEVLTQNILIR